MKVADLPRPLSATWKAAAGVQMLRTVNELSKEPPGPAALPRREGHRWFVWPLLPLFGFVL
jgi:hypothetical protein